jgi:hypothetical protein
MIARTRIIYRRWRQEGWLRGRVLLPLLLVLGFIVVFSWGFYLTGRYGAESHFPQRLWATLAMFTGTYMSLNPNLPVPPADMSVVGVLALSLTLITASSLVLVSRRARDFVRIIHPTARLVVIGNDSTAAALVQSSIDSKIPTILVTDSRASEAARATKPSIPIIASGQIQCALLTQSASRVINHAGHVVVATDSDALNMQLHKKIRDIRESHGRPHRALTTSAGVHVEGDEGAIGRQSGAKDLVVIHDPGYAQLLRPNSIRGCLPSSEVTCPAENIAEHICHLVVAAVTGANDERIAVLKVVEVDPTSIPSRSQSSLASTIETWLRHLAWSLSFAQGDEGQNGKGPGEFEQIPALEVVAGPNGAFHSNHGLFIEVLVGSRPSSIATRVLSQQRAAGVRIVVANTHLIKGAAELRHYGSPDRLDVRTGRAWLDDQAPMNKADGSDGPLILVVDPDEVGLDARLVTDDTGTQWARTFDVTHALMFSGGAGRRSVTAWQPGAPMGESTKELEAQRIRAARSKRSNKHIVKRKELDNEVARQARKEVSNRYSSKRAAERMLRLLAVRGYALRRWEGDGRPDDPRLSAEDIEYIAEAEHENWLTRTWTDTSRLRRRVESVSDYSSSGANKYCYRGLTALESDTDRTDRLRYAANYNRRIASETYPAIAASFGYSIVRFGEPQLPRRPRPRCNRIECPCNKAL